MNLVEFFLRIFVLLTICLSGLLLGMGQQDFEPLVVAIVGGGAATILVDWLKWFRLPQWLANSLAIMVTIVTVSNFYFTNDSVRHLLGVGKLLVYLQTILLFQRKSPRVYWQVLVLSLLQIVVGAVFNLGFEGGLLFILYMMVAGLTMMLLHLYQDRNSVQERHLALLREVPVQSAGETWQSRPIALSRLGIHQRRTMRRMIGNFALFGLGAFVFAIVLFYFLPREHSSWSGPREVPMRVTGFSKQVSMDHEDVILLSSDLEMNVRFLQSDREPFTPRETPYLRGMALSNLRIDGNRTSWIAPPYQIFSSDFRPISPVDFRVRHRFIRQEIVLEPTEDPLLYTVMQPWLSEEDDLSSYEWCWPLGAATRQRSDENITVSHFRYSFKIPVLSNGAFFSSWPYAGRNAQTPLTPQADRGNYQWLTHLDAARYPTLVAEAARIAGEAPDNHLELAQRMEAYFEDQPFEYSLDYRNIERDPELDSVEDFFANFQQGHCEYFASALGLMLRSQGIPARMVVGYRGGDVNEFGGHLDVESRHAHAWIEAYIRPQDCTDFMRRTGQADPRLGAWVRLDPTPAVDLDSDLLAGADDALGLAKSLWRDYVLGLQADTRSRVITTSEGLSGLLRVLDLDYWQSAVSKFADTIRKPGGWRQYVVPFSVVLLICLVVFVTGWTIRKRRRTQTATSTLSTRWTRRIRQRLGRWVSPLSPKLATWVSGQTPSSPEVPFYTKLTKMLTNAGFTRSPHQTPREFAQHVRVHSTKLDDTGQIGVLTRQLTDFYYLVRFGGRSLDPQQQTMVESALRELRERMSGRPNPESAS